MRTDASYPCFSDLALQKSWSARMYTPIGWICSARYILHVCRRQFKIILAALVTDIDVEDGSSFGYGCIGDGWWNYPIATPHP